MDADRREVLMTSSVRLLFLGDFFYDSPLVEADIMDLAHWIDSRDVDGTILNLEGSLSGGRPRRKHTRLELCPDALTDVLFALRVRAVSLANNHVFDFGAEGFERLVSLLQTADIQVFGVSGHGFSRTTTIQTGDMSVVLDAMGWHEEEVISDGGYTINDLCAMKPPAERTGHINVMMPHWGYEYEQLPLPIHAELGRKLIANGYDLVVGSHAHVLQPLESIGSGFIAYGLGNAYFGSRRQRYPLVSDLGAALEVSIESDGIRAVRAWPLLYDRHAEYTRVLSVDRFVGTSLDFKMPSSLTEYNETFRSCRTFGLKPGLYAGQSRLNRTKLFLVHCRNMMSRVLNIAVGASRCARASLKKRVSGTEGGNKS
jgi:hypothetical protein